MLHHFKVNHSFRANNTAFVEGEHPRWGVIICLQCQRSIKAGEEILANYGYLGLDPPQDYPWYFELKKKIDAEDEEIKKKTDKKKAKKKETSNKKKKAKN